MQITLERKIFENNIDKENNIIDKNVNGIIRQLSIETCSPVGLTGKITMSWSLLRAIPNLF